MKLFQSLFISLIILTSSQLIAQKALIECQFTKPSDVAGLKVVAAKMKAECIPKLARIHSCVTRTRLLIDQANDVSNLFVSGDPSKPLMIDASLKGSFRYDEVDLSIWRNFQALETDYQKSLDEIQSLISTYQSKSDDSARIQDYIAELDRGYYKNTDTLAKLSRRESALLFYMEKALDLLRKNADVNRSEVQWVLGNKCKDAELAPVLGQLQLGIEDTLAKIDQIHSVAVESKRARDLLARYSYLALRESLLNRYKSQAIAELGSLDGRLDAVLEVSRLMDQFEHWVSWVASDNDRTATTVLYLQFEGTQRVNAIDLMAAKDFKEKILAASYPYPEVSRPYLPRLDSVIKTFETELTKVGAKGWQGYLSNQIVLADSMLSISDRYSEFCVKNLQSFKEASKLVYDLETYRTNERLFKGAIQGCEVRK